jgi:hypothetical protein
MSEKFGWSRQATDMGRENSVGANFHVWVVPFGAARLRISCTPMRSVQALRLARQRSRTLAEMGGIR